MKKLEEIYDDHIEKIKRTIEKKIKQSQEILRLNKQNQKSICDKNSVNFSRTLALKTELEAKLDLWRKQVLSVQSLSIRLVIFCELDTGSISTPLHQGDLGTSL